MINCKILFVDQKVVNANGNFSTSYKIPSDALTGNYTIYASTSKESAQKSFEVSGECVRGNPSISIQPLSQLGLQGSTLNYSITVENKDSTPCGTSFFQSKLYYSIRL